MLRVRHHTNDEGLNGIIAGGGIRSSRGWGMVETGVHVEVEPFGSTRPWRPGNRGPKNELGSEADGAYVEFDAPPELICYSCGPRNSGIIPVPAGQLFSLQGRNLVFIRVRYHWWQFWRKKPE